MAHRTFPLWFLAAAWLAFLAPLRAQETPPLLREALDHWLSGQEDWAFTQQTRVLHDDGTVKEVRIEQYDPSQPDARRWRLRSVDGRPPTADQRESIEDKRNRKPRKRTSRSLEEFVDFAHATAVPGESAETATFEVPLKPATLHLAQTEKVGVLVTVNKAKRTVERVEVTLREPMKIVLGLARVTDIDFVLNFDPAERASNANKGGAGTPPSGTARIAVSRLGTRYDYAWTDFRRVKTYGSGQ